MYRLTKLFIILLFIPAAHASISKDDIICGGLLSTVIASPFLTVWSFYKTRQNIKLREELEAQTPVLAELLKQADKEVDSLQKELGPDWNVWFRRTVVYRLVLNPESSAYKRLMHLTFLSDAYLMASFGSLAAGGFAWQFLQNKRNGPIVLYC